MDLGLRSSSIKKDLIHAELRLEVIDKTGAIQIPEIKVLLRKLVLREQCPKDENRVITALKCLGIGHFRQESGAYLLNPALGGLLGGGSCLQGGMMLQTQPYSLRK